MGEGDNSILSPNPLNIFQGRISSKIALFEICQEGLKHRTGLIRWRSTLAFQKPLMGLDDEIRSCSSYLIAFNVEHLGWYFSDDPF